MIPVFEGMSFDYKLVIDSGAFTVWKKGKEIRIEDYCEFIKTLPLKPWKYFNLDVIGNPEKTLENYEYMLKQGLTPIPIFTRGEQLNMLEHYYKTSDVVGIGGLVGTKGSKNVVKKVMNVIGDRNVHWLGFTSLQFLKHYKPFMCDSSSASIMARFGGGQIYIGGGRVTTFSKKDFIKRPNPTILKTLTELGFNPTDFTSKEKFRGDLLFSLGYASAIWQMLEVKQKLNVNQFLAVPNVSELKYAIKEFTKITANN